MLKGSRSRCSNWKEHLASVDNSRRFLSLIVAAGTAAGKKVAANLGRMAWMFVDSMIEDRHCWVQWLNSTMDGSTEDRAKMTVHNSMMKDD